MIFKEILDEKIDYALTHSLMRLLEIRVYMQGEFIVTGGTYGRETYIVLDGTAIMFALNGDLIGVLKSGGHFGSETLSNRLQDRRQPNKRLLHVLAKTVNTVVGVLSEENANVLYKAFPDWEKKIRYLNGCFTNSEKLPSVRNEFDYTDEEISKKAMM